MHIFDYSVLKDELLPAQLVNLTANVSALFLKLMAKRSRRNVESAW